MKNVVLLGSTGSIGTSTIKVAEDLPGHIRLVGLGAGNNLELLQEQAEKFRPEAISISDPAKAEQLRAHHTEVFAGAEGLIKLA
ncbi:MAG TPA: 1-deoxy-D-xylulose-5-phosphate reductoisomerase, partial [Candidatus Binatia bacterium]|nr:1-deoxy-D-xylulose-5-phosphate reductoisomerase [Candidatus Binatia bacterium]